MAPPLLPDDVWEHVQRLLPAKPRRSRYPGRLPLGDRQVLTGILFVLKTGISWNELPRDLGCGSGSRCLRRLKEWYYSSVWTRIHAELMARLPGAAQIDWSRAAIDARPSRRGKK